MKMQGKVQSGRKC